MGAPGRGHGRGTPELQRTKAHSMTISLADPLGALKARATLEPVSTLLVTPPRGSRKSRPTPAAGKGPRALSSVKLQPIPPSAWSWEPWRTSAAFAGRRPGCENGPAVQM